MSDTPEPGNVAPPMAPSQSSRHLPQSSTIKSTGILLTVYALWIAVVGVYWPSARDLNTLWTSPQHEEAFTHGYLILLICLWLVFRERERLVSIAAAPSPKALLILLMLSALWLWLWRAAIQEGHEMLLPLIWLTAITATLGWRIGRLLAFPVGYLYFAMPVWSDINGVVQTLSAKMTGALIFLTGLPAFMQGDYVQLPRGEIEIASTCSGLHALIVGLALATLYGKIADVPLRRRWLWIAVMGALSLIVNWIRIFTVITAAVFTDMQSSLVRHHYWLGWWLFAGAFALFLWWTGRKSQLARAEGAPNAGPVMAETGPSTGNRTATTLATLAAFAVLPLISYGLDGLHADAATPGSIAWPADPAGWQASPVQGSEWTPRFVHPSAESLRRYTDRSGRAVEVFTVAYRVQTQDAKLLSFWNHLLAGRGHFREIAERIVSSPTGPWRELRVVGASGARSIIWVRYRIGDRLFVEPRLSQLWYGIHALVKPPVSSLTALRATCESNCRIAYHRLSAAAVALQPSVEFSHRPQT